MWSAPPEDAFRILRIVTWLTEYKREARYRGAMVRYTSFGTSIKEPVSGKVTISPVCGTGYGGTHSREVPQAPERRRDEARVQLSADPAIGSPVSVPRIRIDPRGRRTLYRNHGARRRSGFVRPRLCRTPTDQYALPEGHLIANDL